MTSNRILIRHAIPSPEILKVSINFVFSMSVSSRFLLLLCIFLFMFIAPPIIAQEFEDDPLFLEDEIPGYGGFGDEFQDSDFGISDEFLGPSRGPAEEEAFDPFEPEPTEDELYIDEQDFDTDTEQALRESLIGQRELMAREKREGIANIAYGAGTGLMIGAWSAFITQETTTRNQWRTIGTSTVLGGIIGMMMGTRSIWDPGGSRATTGSLPEFPNWLVNTQEAGFKIAYQWKF